MARNITAQVGTRSPISPIRRRSPGTLGGRATSYLLDRSTRYMTPVPECCSERSWPGIASVRRIADAFGRGRLHRHAEF